MCLKKTGYSRILDAEAGLGCTIMPHRRLNGYVEFWSVLSFLCENLCEKNFPILAKI